MTVLSCKVAFLTIPYGLVLLKLHVLGDVCVCAVAARGSLGIRGGSGKRPGSLGLAHLIPEERWFANAGCLKIKHGSPLCLLRVVNPSSFQPLPSTVWVLEAERAHLPASLCHLPQGDFPLKADRVVQSVKAICNALAAVETPEITSALNQLPPCPSRMQPKIQKVTNSERSCRGQGEQQSKVTG